MWWSCDSHVIVMNWLTVQCDDCAVRDGPSHPALVRVGVTGNTCVNGHDPQYIIVYNKMAAISNPLSIDGPYDRVKRRGCVEETG